jgi:hypothetical protein
MDINAPLSTATLTNPGRISSLGQLHQLVQQGQHVPLWVHKSLAGGMVQKYGNSNAVVPHPGVPIPLPSLNNQSGGQAATPNIPSIGQQDSGLAMSPGRASLPNQSGGLPARPSMASLPNQSGAQAMRPRPAGLGNQSGGQARNPRVPRFAEGGAVRPEGLAGAAVPPMSDPDRAWAQNAAPGAPPLSGEARPWGEPPRPMLESTSVSEGNFPSINDRNAPEPPDAARPALPPPPVAGTGGGFNDRVRAWEASGGASENLPAWAGVGNSAWGQGLRGLSVPPGGIANDLNWRPERPPMIMPGGTPGPVHFQAGGMVGAQQGAPQMPPDAIMIDNGYGQKVPIAKKVIAQMQDAILKQAQGAQTQPAGPSAMNPAGLQGGAAPPQYKRGGVVKPPPQYKGDGIKSLAGETYKGATERKKKGGDVKEMKKGKSKK